MHPNHAGEVGYIVRGTTLNIDGVVPSRNGVCSFCLPRLSSLLLFQSWHKRCFSCVSCSRHLDSTSVSDGPDGEIYCKVCHSGKFGLSGYGFGQGAGTLLSVGHRLLR